MIAVIDYGAGNLRNVCKALEHVGTPLGATIILTDDAHQLERAEKVVLPGVGAFADCQMGLRSRGLWDVTRALALTGKPLLGICVGMQLLFDVGEEMGEWEGLGLIPGRVVRFNFDAGRVIAPDLSTPSVSPYASRAVARMPDARPASLKVPHIGWNQLKLVKPSHPLMNGVPDGGYAYFVHSFHPAGVDASQILATTDYGYDFPSVVAHGNVWGIQFHPEKSQDTGLRMLHNFVAAATIEYQDAGKGEDTNTREASPPVSQPPEHPAARPLAARVLG